MKSAHTSVDERILILAPTGRDASLAAETLAKAGLTAVACAGMPQLLARLTEGAGALLLTEEALADPASLESLRGAIAAQPTWSDLPLILLVGSRKRPARYARATELPAGNITILQRPITVASLVTVFQTALRARRRQYETRDLLTQLNDQNERLALEIAERQQAQADLKRLAESLEQRVVKRTAQLEAANQSLQKEITERRKFQKTLVEERKLLRTLIDTAPAYIFAKDLDGRFLLVNSRVAQLSGDEDKSEFIGKTDFDFLPPAVAARYQSEDQIVIQSNQPLSNEEDVVVGADGNRIWVTYTKVPLRDEQGQVSGVLGIAWDITHRKEMEQRLQASETRFRKIFEEGPLGMGIVDQDYRLVQVNASFCRMLEYSEAELIDRSPFEFTHPDDVEADRELAEKVYRGIIPDYQLQKRFITKSGRTIWVMMTATIFRIEEDDRVFGLGMVEDITEQKRIERERAALLAETSRQRDQLRTLSARLAEVQEREREELVRELHDRVGQTLTALNFNLGFIRSQIPDQLATADIIRSRLSHAIDLVAEATDRTRNVMAELRPPLLDESGLIEALTWYANRLENWTSLTIFVNARSLSPRLAAPTENALFRISQEALNNVVKHAEAGEVTLSLQADAHTVRLEIADDGIGFDAAAQPNGYNEDTWGMRTMFERAQMVNGKCRIESQPGQGTQVIVEVPHTSREKR